MCEHMLKEMAAHVEVRGEHAGIGALRITRVELRL